MTQASTQAYQPVPSPNIWHSADVYEVENLGMDRAGVVDAAMLGLRDWTGLDVLDIGCGSGFHLPGLAARAASVVGVEPYAPLVDRARARTAGLACVRVVPAGAEATGLAAHSVDVAQARWAYFFGPGCEPGLAELARVMRPGGVAFVVDVDAARSTFGGWFSESLPDYDAVAVERFWRRQGWESAPLDLEWTFDTAEDFAAVLCIELSPGVADSVLAADPTRTGVDYAARLRWRAF